MLHPPAHLLKSIDGVDPITVDSIGALKDIGDTEDEKKQSAEFVQRFVDYVEIVEQDLKPGLGDNGQEP